MAVGLSVGPVVGAPLGVRDGTLRSEVRKARSSGQGQFEEGDQQLKKGVHEGTYVEGTRVGVTVGSFVGEKVEGRSVGMVVGSVDGSER